MQPSRLPVISAAHVAPLLEARRRGDGAARVSLDLGQSQTEVQIAEDGVRLPDGQVMSWADVERVARDEASHTEGHCFVVRDGTVERAHIFSPEFNRLYSLVATKSAPTMLISGIPMHRIKDSDPWCDTKSKIRALAPLQGARVLDTATGLGYTAIMAAREAAHVTTCELDPAVLEICRLNPWSAPLFELPNVTQLIGDTFDLIQETEDGAFTRIVHDPPMFNLAGRLYSEAFYRYLYRVLAAKGRLFHYIGNPDSPSGHRVTRGVVRRLQDAGFARVQHRPEAFGVLASK